MTLNTKEIQDAIDACSGDGGGKVVVSNGIYVTGTLHMRSHVELCVEGNAVLKASVNGDDYPDFPCEEWDTKRAPWEALTAAEAVFVILYTEKMASL